MIPGLSACAESGLKFDCLLTPVWRSSSPSVRKGRVYSARNTLQFFTIPIGYLAGGILVDYVFEPFMTIQSPDSI